jgi:hypothetical protein
MIYIKVHQPLSITEPKCLRRKNPKRVWKKLLVTKMNNIFGELIFL